MRIIPIRTKIANEFISKWHRHNKPIDHRSHRFTIGLECNGELVGVGVAGLPIARANDDGKTLEILRVCVKEGYHNANSLLYGRLTRIASMMGYEKVITYTLQKECASSLKAVGAHLEKKINRPSQWSRPARIRKHQDIFDEKKYRWSFKLPTQKKLVIK